MIDLRIMEGFHLRQIAGESIAVPTGPVAAKLSGLAVMNGPGELLFQMLQSEQSVDSLVSAILEEYEIDEATARADVEEFVTVLRENGLLVE